MTTEGDRHAGSTSGRTVRDHRQVKEGAREGSSDHPVSAPLKVAVRGYTVRDDVGERPRRRPGTVPDVAHVLVIDTETTTDPRQALTFGCARYCRVRPDGSLVTVAEILFHADDLKATDPAGYAVLDAYAHIPGRTADVDLTYTACGVDWRLHLMPVSLFLKTWVRPLAWENNAIPGQEPATLVFFNAPFDISRLAGYVATSRGAMMSGGFSFAWWLKDGIPHTFRPRIAVKNLDSKRAFIQYMSTGEKERGTRGHFLDLRTLVFALTGRGHSLSTACDAFGVENGKTAAEQHGVITPDYIDYARRDVQATAELYEKSTAEFSRHPLPLQATKAFSPASVAKAYLRTMGITPPLDRSPLPPDILGACMSAFYGGRAECRIRNTPVPVELVDYTSMYPTVDSLMNLWELLTARHVDVKDDTHAVREFLETITLEQCFRPETWPSLVGMVQLDADGDILPVRADYSDAPGWNIGINPLTSNEPLWFTLPDAVAATLLTGRPPRIRKAIRFHPARGKLPGLTPVKLRGTVPVDPGKRTFSGSWWRNGSASNEASAIIPEAVPVRNAPRPPF